MIPLKLRITGFLSYLDTVELDFTGFDLACISGLNGAGKSSLLDAITWALFGQARRRDDAIINTHAPVAEVRLDFSYEDNVYRVQRSKLRDKATLLDFFIRQDGEDESGWKALTERSVRETETRIEQTLRMDYETFINASFFLQGKADQFAQQRPGDRKRILSSILGLEVWETYREKTVEQRKALEADSAGLEGRIREIESELAEEPARRQRLEELEAGLAEHSRARAAQEQTVEALRQLAASLARQREHAAELEGQWRTIQENLDGLGDRLEQRRAERSRLEERLGQAEKIEAAHRDWLQTRDTLAHWDEIAARFRIQEQARQAPFLEIEKARHALEGELERLREAEAGIQAGRAEAQTLRGQIVALQRELDAGRRRLDQRALLEEEQRDLQQKRADARAENPRLKQEMDELKERIDRLAETSGALCPLCGQPLNPDERVALIATLNQQGKTLGERYRKNRALLTEFEKSWKQLTDDLAALEEVDQSLRLGERRLDQMALRAQSLAEAETDWLAQGAPRGAEVTRRLAEADYAPLAQAELARLEDGLRKLGYDATEHDAVRRRELAGRGLEEELRRLGEARAALEPLAREIGDLEKQVESLRQQAADRQTAYERAAAEYSAAAAKAPDLIGAENQLLQQREEENRLRMDIGAARQKVNVLDDLRVRLKDFNQQREERLHQVSRLKTIERAFSKDGVPALLIEQALPEIQLQTNQLLELLSGGNMSVSFETQREYKDKNRSDLRETLDIRISDWDGVRDYELFSGGEAFRVNFAIRLALSRVLAQRAGARLKTLVIDEGFGSQDAQGRLRLVEAINLVRKDFAKVLVITHLDELKEYFPNRIEVEKTPRGSTVRVV